ncbi:uncharacterized protein DUF4386 [Kribbella orskensis]|uniref:Uncharacterized protein DUF4386 n=1 Tax=Kribbella orskensis TaxID=2512216 RepID=A0ABY2BL53_9ACTN|nr:MULTISPECIES: DUF4386 family protein [Kribbella]TCN40774.1 uncharacterized protein DUF4386 [Kribbella sp. VKM Ac-2500]TCO24026.1 uncharacterized protein DUF4386 [Kribbella orskensis]
MTERHELRWGGIAGLAFVVLALLGRFLAGNPPTVADSGGTISSWLNDHRTTVLFSSLMWAAAAGLVIWFAAAFAEAIREREERSDVHLALLAGSVLVGGAVFVNGALTAASAFSIAGRDEALTVLMYNITAVMTTMIGFAAALPLAAAGIGVLRTHLMPNWLGYLALLAALVSFAGAFGVFATDGVFVAGGNLMSTVPLLLSAVWIVCASGFMVREHLPEITTGEAALPQQT